MLKSIGIFVDVSNLYYCVGKKWEGAKVDYERYIEEAAKTGILKRAIAYGAQMNDEAHAFITALKYFGFETRYKKPKTYKADDGTITRKADWDVGLAMDVVRMLPRLDVVVLGSADSDLEELVLYCRHQGAQVIVFACNVSRELKIAANSVIEINENLLQGAKVETEDDEETEEVEATETTE